MIKITNSNIKAERMISVPDGSDKPMIKVQSTHFTGTVAELIDLLMAIDQKARITALLNADDRE